MEISPRSDLALSTDNVAEGNNTPRTPGTATTFQKIRRLGFSAYVIMCFMVTLFCMGMLLLAAFKKPEGTDHSTFYASTISFILGKFTILVMDKLIKGRATTTTAPSPAA